MGSTVYKIIKIKIFQLLPLNQEFSCPEFYYIKKTKAGRGFIT